MPGSPVNVRISRENHDRLEALYTKTRMPKGRIVDDALSLFFTPAEQRSDQILLRRLDRLEDALEGTNRNIEFNADMIAEFVWRWLSERQGEPNPKSDETEIAKAFQAFTQRVIERNGIE